MRRRSLLTAGIAAAASPTLSSPSHSAAAERDAEVLTHAWTCPPNRYVITLRGAAVSCDCFGLDALPGLESAGDGAPGSAEFADAAIVAIGPRRHPVTWRAEAWRQPDASTLTLTLRGVEQPLLADMTFSADGPSGLVTAHTVLRHAGEGADVDISATLGFWFGIHEPIDTMIYLTGSWAEESRVHRWLPGDEPLVLESRTGKTGFEFQPYVALRSGATTFICQIFWSGNWALRIEPNQTGATLLGGLNNWRFRHRLSAGDSLTLPSVLFGRIDGGLGEATLRLHDYRRAHRPDADRPIPVQFNSWYPYSGEPSAETMLPIVPAARRLGCEAFVVDAGWYRTDEGDSDADWSARTGDWRVSRRRFPNGLREVSQRCRENGLLFGLWFEPEVIGPGSSIRRQYPQWLHNIDARPPRADERAVLNLGVPAAWQHVFDRITRMIEVLDVRWMKWDFNADLGAGGWAPGLPETLTTQDPLVAHYRALYRLQDAIREAFPDLTLEMCASGGGRMDGEILSHAHVNWISDQPGPLRKLAIHFGTGLAHPAVVCNDWLIEWPPGVTAGYDDKPADADDRGDLPFRLRVAMLGSFGFSARLDRWSDADFRVAAAHVALYTARLRPIIHHGDQYHLTRAPPPDGQGDWAAIWYVAKNGLTGILFAFRLSDPASERAFPLPGLRAGRQYRASFFSGHVVEASGDALAVGLSVAIAGEFQSELCLVEAD